MFRPDTPHWHIDIQAGESRRKFHTNRWRAVIALMDSYIHADEVSVRRITRRNRCGDYTEITKDTD